MKWIARIMLLGFVITVLVGVSAYYYLKGSDVPSDAHYGIQTYYEEAGVKIPKRVYYAEEVRLKDGILLLIDYWDFDGVRYNKHKGEREILPPYKLTKRRVEG